MAEGRLLDRLALEEDRAAAAAARAAHAAALADDARRAADRRGRDRRHRAVIEAQVPLPPLLSAPSACATRGPAASRSRWPPGPTQRPGRPGEAASRPRPPPGRDARA